ncbi:lactonase family protein [Amycolatopsis palatopharyngis]|uniref:lactonase family protein n=1 Tax=Amycolatopsis palatopharyngis TaxID=187982 RepID=UPI000E24F40E|nr:lactonase family protein [Amycolatopsis palatopharyngis]
MRTATVLARFGYTRPQLAPLTVAASAGSLIASHVCDGVFWIVSRYFGISVADTPRTRTVLSLTGFGLATALMAFVWTSANADTTGYTTKVGVMTGMDRRRFLGAAGTAGLGTVLTAPAAFAAPRAAETTGGGATAFLGSYSTWGSPPGQGLQVAARSRAALDVVSTVAGVPDASFLAFSRDRRRMYVTNELVPDGTVTAVDVCDPRRPRVLGTRSTRGAGPTHLSVHPGGRHLLTANYTDGTVVVHPILRDGTLGESTDLVQHTGDEREPHAHQVLTDPTGRWVLAVDLGADSVYVYHLDRRAGTLAPHRQVRLPSGAGPRHLAFHPGGRFAYILGELRPEITIAAWNPGSGELTLGEPVPTVDDDAQQPQYPAEIAVSGDGRFVYASNRGEDTIATFAAGRTGDALQRIGNVSTGGVWPRHFTLDPSQRWIYVANQRSGTVTWLPRDPHTGLPGSVAGSVSVPSAAIVTFA